MFGTNLFGIGVPELMFIAILALIVLGPQRLPGVMRELAKFLRQMRAIGTELTSQFSEELQMLDELNPNKLLEEATRPTKADSTDAQAKVANVKTKTSPVKTDTAEPTTKKSGDKVKPQNTKPKTASGKPALGETDTTIEDAAEDAPVEDMAEDTAEDVATEGAVSTITKPKKTASAKKAKDGSVASQLASGKQPKSTAETPNTTTDVTSRNSDNETAPAEAEVDVVVAMAPVSAGIAGGESENRIAPPEKLEAVAVADGPSTGSSANGTTKVAVSAGVATADADPVVDSAVVNSKVVDSTNVIGDDGK